MTIDEIWKAHREYDKIYDRDGFWFTLPDIIEGLAIWIRLGVVEPVPDQEHCPHNSREIVDGKLFCCLCGKELDRDS